MTGRLRTEPRSPLEPLWGHIEGCHPTIRRLNTSETNAVNAIPDEAGILGEVEHPHVVLAAAVKSRLTRSGGWVAAGLALVVTNAFPRRTP